METAVLKVLEGEFRSWFHGQVRVHYFLHVLWKEWACLPSHECLVYDWKLAVRARSIAMSVRSPLFLGGRVNSRCTNKQMDLHITHSF